MKTALKEPLVHFLLAGSLLFAAYYWTGSGGDTPAPEQVRIGPGEVEWLTQMWSRQWQRPPTQDELRGLVTDYLREELLANEARAMGLEAGDTVVRRRLAQKMDFLIEDTAQVADPSDDELRRYFDAHADLFDTAARITFTHVFFNPEKHPDPAADAASALEALARGTDPATLGDPSMIEAAQHDVSERDVASQFGRDFAHAVFAAPSGHWSGPIASGYGTHLVHVDSITPGGRPDFATVKPKVLERWRDDRKVEDRATYFASLLEKYDVSIDESVKPLIGPLDSPVTPPPPTEDVGR